MRPWSATSHPVFARSIPAKIGHFRMLSSLFLCENAISQLPPALFDLTRLVCLDLSQNRLSSLPPEIGRMAQLRALHVADNDLTISSTSSELRKLTRLHSLSLSGNEGLKELAQDVSHPEKTAIFVEQVGSYLWRLEHTRAAIDTLTLIVRKNDEFWLPPEILHRIVQQVWEERHDEDAWCCVCESDNDDEEFGPYDASSLETETTWENGSKWGMNKQKN